MEGEMKTMEEIDWNEIWKNAMEDMVEERG